jgi:hypothetical protein
MENKTQPEIKRLHSLDALRGFDMFWIMGGEGIVIATALLGMFTGEFIMSDYLKEKQVKKVVYLILSGVALVLIGLLWNELFPINKNLWSSSFFCFVGGLNLMLFSLFYLVIDVWNFKKWAFFFTVIGMNSITIYLATDIIGFGKASKFLFGGIKDLAPVAYGPFFTLTLNLYD